MMAVNLPVLPFFLLLGFYHPYSTFPRQTKRPKINPKKEKKREKYTYLIYAFSFHLFICYAENKNCLSIEFHVFLFRISIKKSKQVFLNFFSFFMHFLDFSLFN
jgi:hypothetical protein